MNVAVYAGSFDPVTYGHIDIIDRAVRLFDKVIIAAIVNPEKTPLLTLKQRMELLTEVAGHHKNVEIDSFDGLLVDYMKRKKARILLRGLRAVSDFDFEFQIAETNQKMMADMETLFMMTSSEYSYLSSSLVKQIARLGGPVDKFVPPSVQRMLSGVIQKR